MAFFDRIRKSRYISPEERKNGNIQYIQKQGIAYLDSLPPIMDSREARLRPWEQVVDRAIAALISAQLAIDIIERGDVDEAQIFCLELLEQYGVRHALLAKEKRLFDGEYTRQDAIDIVWNYESYWALVWALGLIGEKQIGMPSCDEGRAIELVAACQNRREFVSHCKPRDVEEILTKLDLYYRYHWACVEQRIDPDAEIGSLNPDAVWERRKALEWLFSDVDEWDEIELDT